MFNSLFRPAETKVTSATIPVKNQEDKSAFLPLTMIRQREDTVNFAYPSAKLNFSPVSSPFCGGNFISFSPRTPTPFSFSPKILADITSNGHFSPQIGAGFDFGSAYHNAMEAQNISNEIHQAYNYFPLPPKQNDQWNK